MANDFLFADEAEESITVDDGKWKILIVDDEPEVHTVTTLALSDFQFQGKGIEFLSAHSGEEAQRVILANPDIAIVLLDVVMETDDAGLKVASFIRNEAKNNFVRIILRTGQPGQAPEREVIVNYDINDYKSKTELTAQKLFTVIMASLRSYRDILSLEQNRIGLEKIITASANIFSVTSLEGFIDGIMRQLTSIIGGSDRAMYVTTLVAESSTALSSGNDLIVVAGQGEFEEMEGRHVQDVLNPEMRLAFKDAIKNREIVYGEDFLIAYCASRASLGSLLYLSGLQEPLADQDKHLIEVFAQNVQIAFENISLKNDIEDTQRELVMRLTEAVEQRGEESGNHVRRVGELCELLAQLQGVSPIEAERIKLAAPLHDIGKIGIAETLLKKADSLEAQEMAEIRNHALNGYEILKDSNRPIIQIGAILARDHHERWDGTGYPHGKKQSEIHLYGRIMALIDSYDSLRHQRCYKDAWELDEVLTLLTEQRGKHFDPDLVDMFVKNIDKFEVILKKHPN